MFAPSTIAISAAVLEITDSAGVSADTEMNNRALRSLAAAVKHFNGRYFWSWLLTEAAPVGVTGPFSVAVTASAGETSAAADAGHGVKIDDFLVGSGFPVGVRVSATAVSGFDLNMAVTGTVSATISANRDFYDIPSDVRNVYSFRSLGNLRALAPANRRAYDRSVADEFTAGTPYWYDMFSMFQRSKVRLLPPPDASDTFQLRYYRRMSVPSTSATATVLDIPQDYDSYLISWAKWHFLTDKGNTERATTWLSLAQEGLKLMIADQIRLPDVDLAFSQSPRFWPGRSDTRYLPWEYS